MRTALMVVTLAWMMPVAAFAQDIPGVSLHWAALQGHMDQVQAHIRAGSDLNARDAYGSTPLTLAVLFGRRNVVHALLQAGADLTIGDAEDSTPLHLAALLGRPAMVRLLLEHGADVHARNRSGSTPADLVLPSMGYDLPVYEQMVTGLGPLGWELDTATIRKVRPEIARMLRPSPDALATTNYTPLPDAPWPVSTPEQEGLNPSLVAELFFDAAHMTTPYALLILKNGKLVAEGYFNAGAVDHKNRLASVTKSVTSALVGLALEDGCLDDLDRPMVEYFPEVQDGITDVRKYEITVRHLLQMRGGFPWVETDTAYWQALLTGYYPHLIANLPLVNDPGEGFNYSNLSSNWLGILLTRTCGTDLLTFAQDRLFAPLGIQAGDWGQDAEGHYNGCGNLHLSARDLAKFGLLYLRNGQYHGVQVLPAGWTKASLQQYSDDAWVAVPPQNHVGRYFRELGYGYQWWSARIGDRRYNFAWGHGGQLIVLADHLDMVIVLISKPYFLEHNQEAWSHEQGNINLIGKFVFLLDQATGQ
ncbi:MAG: serine hydrolase [Saprospiraceae bacterium]|nr:serine hydrolase [Saprospiraceae bacterium]